MENVLMRFAAVLFCVAATCQICGSVCCEARDRNRAATCNNCTASTTCCGNGACNAFCCNCVDGCRGTGSSNCPAQPEANTSRTHVTRVAAYGDGKLAYRISEERVTAARVTREGILREADRDADGRLSYAEADYYLAHVVKRNHYKGQEDLREVDENRDGFISVDEIDPKDATRLKFHVKLW